MGFRNDDRSCPGYTWAMHELGIVLEIHRSCRETVREHGGGRLQRVRIAVGELAAVEPDLLKFGWEAVVADSPEAGAELVIEWCKAVQSCASCGCAKERSDGSWLRLCPDCGTPLRVDGGDELDILEITFETDDDDETAAAASTP